MQASPVVTDAALVDRCAPKTSVELIGNKASIDRLRQYFTSYKAKKPSHIWVFIHGPPGVGKTSAVRLLASEAGFEVREFNASETRTRQSLNKEVPPILENTPLYFCKPPCLVLEEVDGMSAGSDKDGLTTIGALVKAYEKRLTHRVPVILVANEATKPLKDLAFGKKNVLVLQFTKLDVAAIRYRLQSCFRTLGFPPDFQPIDEFITNSDGDFRKTINAHQFWLSKQIQKGQEAKLCSDIGKSIKADRDILTPNDAYKRLFRDDITDLDDLLRSDEFDPFLMRQFVHENLLQMLCVDAPRKNYMITEDRTVQPMREVQKVPMEPKYVTPICAMMSNGDLFQAKYLEHMAGLFLTVAPVDQAVAVWNYHKKDPLHPVHGANVPTLNQMLERGQLYPQFPVRSMTAISKFRKLNDTLRLLARHLCDTGNAAIDARPQIYLYRREVVPIFNKDGTDLFADTLEWMMDHHLTVELMAELLKIDPPLGCDEKEATVWPVDAKRIQRFIAVATNDKVTKVGLKRKRDELAGKGATTAPKPVPRPAPSSSSLSSSASAPSSAAATPPPVRPAGSGMFAFARNARPAGAAVSKKP